MIEVGCVCFFCGEGDEEKKCEYYECFDYSSYC